MIDHLSKIEFKIMMIVQNCLYRRRALCEMPYEFASALEQALNALKVVCFLVDPKQLSELDDVVHSIGPFSKDDLQRLCAKLLDYEHELLSRCRAFHIYRGGLRTCQCDVDSVDVNAQRRKVLDQRATDDEVASLLNAIYDLLVKEIYECIKEFNKIIFETRKINCTRSQLSVLEVHFGFIFAVLPYLCEAISPQSLLCLAKIYAVKVKLFFEQKNTEMKSVDKIEDMRFDSLITFV